MADIFISYAREDQDRVAALVGALQAEGFSVWWDSHIESGAEYAKDIEKALTEARAVIVAWSTASIDSPWVRDEAALARDQKKLVPIRLGAIEAPLGFRQYQSADFSAWSGDKRAPEVAALCAQLRRRVADAPSTSGEVELTPETDTAPARPQIAALERARADAREQAMSPLSPEKRTGLNFGSRVMLFGLVGLGALALVAILVGGNPLRGLGGALHPPGASAPAPKPTGPSPPPPPDAGALNTPASEADASGAAPTGMTGKAKPSIAVLPFDDFSLARDQGYFADGVAEELLNSLARIEGLRVASRTSAFAFKERETSLKDIAAALGVNHIVEGSVRKAGSTLRITAQLIDAEKDEHLWSKTFERPLTAENIFAIQDEIAAAIASEMLARMGGLPSPLMSGSSKLPAAAFAAGRSQTRSTEAYEAYLRGRQLVAERAAATGPAAIKEFERAIALDPAFAAAHAGLVDAYVIAAEYSGYDLKTATAAAERHAAIALDLAPASAEALTANAVLKIDAGENEAGLAFADRALLANPNLADAHHRRALALIGLGRAAEAYEELKIVKALDPLNPNALSNITVMSLEFGDFETAKAAAADNIKWNPRSAIAHKSESELLARLGDYAGAHRSLKTAEALNPTDKSLADYFAQLYWEIDMKAEARTYANRWLSKAILSTGDRTTALALAAANANDPYAGVIANLAGDSRQAAAYCRKGLERLNLPTLKDAVGVQFLALSCYDALRKFGDETDAESVAALKRLLDQRFGGPPPDAYVPYDDYYVGAAFRLLEGDDRGALAWIDRWLKDGQVIRLAALSPLFAQKKGEAAFKTRFDRMEQNAARHRAAIAAQLAKPEAGWVVK